jgi:hypothetical protein
MNDVHIACADGTSVWVSPGGNEGEPGNMGAHPPQLFQTAAYWGREGFGAYDKCYWNVALGLDQLGPSCVLEAGATATAEPADGDGSIAGGAAVDGAAEGPGDADPAERVAGVVHRSLGGGEASERYAVRVPAAGGRRRPVRVPLGSDGGASCGARGAWGCSAPHGLAAPSIADPDRWTFLQRSVRGGTGFGRGSSGRHGQGRRSKAAVFPALGHFREPPGGSDV